MAGLLVSVRSAAEAQTALAGGAALIDVKEPERGPLGRADDATVAEVVAAVASRCPVSAALGEIRWGVPASPLEGFRRCAYLKPGLAGAWLGIPAPAKLSQMPRMASSVSGSNTFLPRSRISSGSGRSRKRRATSSSSPDRSPTCWHRPPSINDSRVS